MCKNFVLWKKPSEGNLSCSANEVIIWLQVIQQKNHDKGTLLQVRGFLCDVWKLRANTTIFVFVCSAFASICLFLLSEGKYFRCVSTVCRLPSFTGWLHSVTDVINSWAIFKFAILPHSYYNFLKLAFLSLAYSHLGWHWKRAYIFYFERQVHGTTIITWNIQRKVSSSYIFPQIFADYNVMCFRWLTYTHISPRIDLQKPCCFHIKRKTYLLNNNVNHSADDEISTIWNAQNEEWLW